MWMSAGEMKILESSWFYRCGTFPRYNTVGNVSLLWFLRAHLHSWVWWCEWSQQHSESGNTSFSVLRLCLKGQTVTAMMSTVLWIFVPTHRSHSGDAKCLFCAVFFVLFFRFSEYFSPSNMEHYLLCSNPSKIRFGTQKRFIYFL